MTSGRPAPPRFRLSRPATLLGGGGARLEDLELALRFAPELIGVDGGANLLRETAHRPRVVLGDLDSLDDQDHWRERAELLAVPEQDDTDFEKALRLVEAPFYLGVGFLGGRIDHTLAALNALLARADRTIVLLSERDLAFLAPLSWRARLGLGARLAITPLRPVRAIASAGLTWPVDGLDLAFGAQISASNQASAQETTLRFDRRGALITLARDQLATALTSLGVGAGAPPLQ